MPQIKIPAIGRISSNHRTLNFSTLADSYFGILIPAPKVVSHVLLSLHVADPVGENRLSEPVLRAGTNRPADYRSGSLNPFRNALPFQFSN
jgi:hypothetical protein